MAKYTTAEKAYRFRRKHPGYRPLTREYFNYIREIWPSIYFTSNLINFHYTQDCVPSDKANRAGIYYLHSIRKEVRILNRWIFAYRDGLINASTEFPVFIASNIIHDRDNPAFLTVCYNLDQLSLVEEDRQIQTEIWKKTRDFSTYPPPFTFSPYSPEPLGRRQKYPSPQEKKAIAELDKQFSLLSFIPCLKLSCIPSPSYHKSLATQAHRRAEKRRQSQEKSRARSLRKKELNDIKTAVASFNKHSRPLKPEREKLKDSLLRKRDYLKQKLEERALLKRS